MIEDTSKWKKEWKMGHNYSYNNILKPPWVKISSNNTYYSFCFGIGSNFKLRILEAEEPLPMSTLYLISLEFCIIYAYVIT